MAHLMGPTRESNSRGQLFLIGAIALAVAFVSLTMLLNTAIYAENLATRGETVGGDSAAQFATSTTEHVSGALETVNYPESTDPETEFNEIISDMDKLLSRHYAGSSVLVDISTESISTGNVSHGTLTAGGEDAGETTLVSEDSVYDFRLTIVPEDLTDDSFSVTVNGEEYHIVPGNDETAIRVCPAGMNSGQCQSEGNPMRENVCIAQRDEGSDYVTVDFLRGTVAGDTCEALNSVGSLQGTPEIALSHPDGDVGGEYMVTTASGSNGIRMVEVNVTYTDSSGTYTDTIRVSPGGATVHEP